MLSIGYAMPSSRLYAACFCHIAMQVNKQLCLKLPQGSPNYSPSVQEIVSAEASPEAVMINSVPRSGCNMVNSTQPAANATVAPASPGATARASVAWASQAEMAMIHETTAETRRLDKLNVLDNDLEGSLLNMTYRVIGLTKLCQIAYVQVSFAFVWYPSSGSVSVCVCVCVCEFARLMGVPTLCLVV